MSVASATRPYRENQGHVKDRYGCFEQVLEFLERIWLVGCFGFNGLLRKYFSLYRAVSQRERERGEKG